MSVLRTEHIVKDYPGTRALDDVTVSFAGGQVHALIGKNGSGKSTLVKVFAGVIEPTSGQFFLDDDELHFSSPIDAREHGIATVYQELSLVPYLSVAPGAVAEAKALIRRLSPPLNVAAERSSVR